MQIWALNVFRHIVRHISLCLVFNIMHDISKIRQEKCYTATINPRCLILSLKGEAYSSGALIWGGAYLITVQIEWVLIRWGAYLKFYVISYFLRHFTVFYNPKECATGTVVHQCAHIYINMQDISMKISFFWLYLIQLHCIRITLLKIHSSTRYIKDIF